MLPFLIALFAIAIWIVACILAPWFVIIVLGAFVGVQIISYFESLEMKLRDNENIFDE